MPKLRLIFAAAASVALGSAAHAQTFPSPTYQAVTVQKQVALGNWATGSEPLAPATGWVGYDTTRAAPVFWNGAAWQVVGSVTSVAASGGTTGLTFSGGPITGTGTLTLGGTLGVANGGTGAASLTAHSVLIGAGTSAVAGAAPGTAGLVMMSNGAAADPTFQALPSSAVNGTTAGGNAASGILGEYISSNVAVGSAIALTTGTAADVTSISLTAGDWDVCGNVGFSAGASTTIAALSGWIGTTSASTPTAPNSGAEATLTGTLTTGGSNILPVGCRRVNVSITTTVYLSASSTFGTSTMAAYGFIAARRAR